MTKLRIEAGRYYKTRDGEKIGPMYDHGGNDWPFTEPGSDAPCWSRDGHLWDEKSKNPCDLIALWQEPTSQGPVRTKTVTTKSIVPGTYGIVSVRMDPHANIAIVRGTHTAEELRAAAAILLEIAEALDAQG